MTRSGSSRGLLQERVLSTVKAGPNLMGRSVGLSRITGFSTPLRSRDFLVSDPGRIGTEYSMLHQRAQSVPIRSSLEEMGFCRK